MTPEERQRAKQQRKLDVSWEMAKEHYMECDTVFPDHHEDFGKRFPEWPRGPCDSCLKGKPHFKHEPRFKHEPCPGRVGRPRALCDFCHKERDNWQGRVAEECNKTAIEVLETHDNRCGACQQLVGERFHIRRQTDDWEEGGKTHTREWLELVRQSRRDARENELPG